MQLNPYIFFNGNCEEVFKFYEKVLGRKITSMRTYAGTPAEATVPPEWRNKVIHAHMTVGDHVLMASDAPPEHYHEPKGFSVNLTIKKSADAERIFHALAENGKVQMPIQETFWAERFGLEYRG